MHNMIMHKKHTHALCTHHRHGIFIPPELNDFTQLLQRLGRVHTLFSHPHPLTRAFTTTADAAAGHHHLRLSGREEEEEEEEEEEGEGEGEDRREGDKEQEGEEGIEEECASAVAGGKDKAVVSLESFHSHFISFLIRSRCISLLYHYLDTYG